MRIVHFSDTHLGYSDYGKFDSQTGINQRELDTYRVFTEIIDYVVKIKPDLVIHAGDLFDNPRPSNRSIRVAMQQLYRLSQENIPTVIIAGNHSTPRQISTDSVFKILEYFPNIFPVSDGKFCKIKIGKCAIHAIPHMYTTEELIEATNQLVPDNNFEYNIFVTHAAIRGSTISSSGELKEQTIPANALNPKFNYIALGHYHRCLKIKDNAYYSGSPERFSFNEIKDSKCFLDIRLDNFKVTKIPVKAREMVVYGPINCSNLTALEIMKLFESMIHNKIEGKIVKVIFDKMDRHNHLDLDFKKIRDLVKCALHYEPEYRWNSRKLSGDARTSKIGSLNDEFINYLKRENLTKKEREEMTTLGTNYLELVNKVMD